MLARNEIDFPSDERWAFPPEERDRVVREIIARARIEQAKAMRALVRALLLTGPKAIALATLRTIRDGWEAYRTWRKQRKGIAELHALDGRHLKDIGLRRGEIESVIYGQGSDDTRQLRDKFVMGRASRVPKSERNAA